MSPGASLRPGELPFGRVEPRMQDLIALVDGEQVHCTELVERRREHAQWSGDVVVHDQEQRDRATA
jgi:hypothetical protein